MSSGYLSYFPCVVSVGSNCGWASACVVLCSLSEHSTTCGMHADRHGKGYVSRKSCSFSLGNGRSCIRSLLVWISVSVVLITLFVWAVNERTMREQLAEQLSHVNEKIWDLEDKMDLINPRQVHDYHPV